MIVIKRGGLSIQILLGPSVTVFFLRFIFVCMSISLHVCVCTACVQFLKRPAKAFHLWEQEIQTVVSHHTGVGN